MQKIDLQTLGETLNAMADATNGKPVSAKGLEVWFETLREFATHRVLGLLKDWPKSHAKFPAPSEVWRVLNEVGIEERQRLALAEKEQRKKEIEQMGRSPQGQRCLKMISDILSKPRPTPLVHWQRALFKSKPGTITHEYATAALKRLQPRLEREPGQDDEEVVSA